jgi:uncharacterized NAD(P)/FAD-binding protein YdhS
MARLNGRAGREPGIVGLHKVSRICSLPARPGPHGLGLDAAESGVLLDEDGVPSEVLFPLGPPLRGLWYETTAIPEISVQATELARHLTSTALPRRRQYRPGSAA